MVTTVFVTEEELERSRAWGREQTAILRAATPTSLARMVPLLEEGHDWYWLRNTFLDWMRQRESISQTDRQAALGTVPPLTGDLMKDAELAGMAEQLAIDYGLTVPAWVEAPERFLPEGSEYWTYDTPEGRDILRERGLVSFARHGVFVMPNHLTRM